MTPLIRLGELFPDLEVYAKCEFLTESGSFKTRGANHLLTRLSQNSQARLLVVPSMGNTALGVAAAARRFGYQMVGVVPESISRDKDEKLQAQGVELVKVAGGGSDLLQRATEVAQQRGGYFVHPHLDPLWTDGYRSLAEELRQQLPDCRSLVIPVGGGGLLMGLSAPLGTAQGPTIFGCEAYNAPTYAPFQHERQPTIADGLMLEVPHPAVQQRIAQQQIAVSLVDDVDIRSAMRGLYDRHALVVEPSSAVTVAYVQQQGRQLPPPVCVVLTGSNIARAEFERLIEV